MQRFVSWPSGGRHFWTGRNERAALKAGSPDAGGALALAVRYDSMHGPRRQLMAGYCQLDPLQMRGKAKKRRSLTTAGCLATVMQSTAKSGKLSKVWSETPAEQHNVTAVRIAAAVFCKPGSQKPVDFAGI